ncbi:MAG: hypothetical protein OIF57_00965 [Marinobacterium sp.]|nr:hypothetical protein [Marinobacterium sp.]
MIVLHATKKLSARLPLTVDSNGKGRLPVPAQRQGAYAVSSATTDHAENTANPLSDWHGNLLTIQRRNCLLLVHDVTRFALFIPCLSKADLANLDWHFADTLMNTLLKTGCNEQQLNHAAELLQRLLIDNDCNRSVQGTMNQMKGDLEHLIAYDGLNIADCSGYRIGAWLSDRPCTVKGQKDCIWPIKAMQALLD